MLISTHLYACVKVYNASRYDSRDRSFVSLAFFNRITGSSGDKNKFIHYSVYLCVLNLSSRKALFLRLAMVFVAGVCKQSSFRSSTIIFV